MRAAAAGGGGTQTGKGTTLVPPSFSPVKVAGPKRATFHKKKKKIAHKNRTPLLELLLIFKTYLRYKDLVDLYF